MWHNGVVRTEKDLKLASRDTLLTIIAEQQVVITELRRRIEDLERRGPPRGRPVGMPGNKHTPKRPRPERTVHQLKLSVGAIVEAIHRVARQAQRTVDETLERIPGSPVAHADETGWREDGVNGYVWTFSTPTERYFVRRGRDKRVVDEVLGESFDGVLVSDFYAAYNHYPGLKQRRWVHLLRDIHELKALYPEDTGLVRWAGAVRQLYDRAREYAEAGVQPASGYRRLVSPNQLMLESQLLSLCHPFSNDEAAPQAKLCRRIERFIKELFVFVSHPDVPSENNAAERSLSDQPQDQRRHSIPIGNQQQDDSGVPIGHLESKGPQPSLRIPQPARFSSTLKSYNWRCVSVSSV